MSNVTVLTGDIVNSTQLDPQRLDELVGIIDACAREISGWETPVRPVAFARRGGDGWQMAHEGSAVMAMRSALFIQASLRSTGEDISTRIAAATGVGQLDPEADLNSAHGAVFRASGRGLEQLPGWALLSHASGGALDAAFILADHISKGWTQAQARAVRAMLPPDAGPRRAAADALGISRQAVDQALHAAGFPALMRAMTRLETK